jgi:hypothetical protein
MTSDLRLDQCQEPGNSIGLVGLGEDMRPVDVMTACTIDDTTVRRGRITKQGSRPVRWAAIERVKILPKTSHVGAIREQVAHRRGNRNIGAVAAARRQLELVF